MQHLEVSGAVRPLKWSLGVKWLIVYVQYFGPIFKGQTIQEDCLTRGELTHVFSPYDTNQSGTYTAKHPRRTKASTCEVLYACVSNTTGLSSDVFELHWEVCRSILCRDSSRSSSVLPLKCRYGD